MRALLADHDPAMLEAVRRAIGSSSGITLEIATSKQECVQRMRAARCQVLIACERLTDGSGLELLGQVANRSPATLRIFAAEPGRLALLIGGRLAPFRLYQTLPYPVRADVLLPLLVQARAHSLESVLPTAAIRTRLAASTRIRSAETRAPPVPTTPPHELTIDPTSVVPIRALEPASASGGHRHLLIGTALLLSAALVLLVVRLQSANSAGASVNLDLRAPVIAHPEQPLPSADWNSPAVASIVSELELALARRDNARASAALQKLRIVAPTHPRIEFFEMRLQQAAAPIS